MKKILILSLVLSLTLNLLAKTPKSEPSKIDVLEMYWKAVRLYDEENYAQAALCFTHLQSRDPKNYDLNFYTGMCFYNLNKPKLATFYLTSIMDDNVYKYKVMLLTHNELEIVEAK